jgi:hypothetical protein
MNEESASSKAEFEPLSCSSIIYRALLRKGWIDQDTRRVKADAYFLRDSEAGLSVNIAQVCSPERCAKPFKNCFGVASLHVGRVRDLGLDVVRDSRIHANITGLPHRADELAEAERLAGLLAKQSRIVWLPPL